MDKSFNDLTKLCDDPAASKLECEICYQTGVIRDMHTCSCLHVFCKPCLLTYLSCLNNENIFFPIKCPSLNCDTEIFNAFKYLLPIHQYRRIKSIRKIRKSLKDPNISWCRAVNCQGYSLKNQPHHNRCFKCKRYIQNTKDQERKVIIKQFNLIECPVCGALICREILCVAATCYCGSKFCLNCGNEEERHQGFCVFRNKQGKILNFVTVVCLYSWLLFPWFPGLAFLLYREVWNKSGIWWIDSHLCVVIMLMALFSPFIMVVCLIVLPFCVNGLCVRFLLDNKISGKVAKAIFVMVYVAAIVPVAMGFWLFTGLALLFMPVFGIYLLTQTFKSRKSVKQ